MLTRWSHATSLVRVCFSEIRCSILASQLTSNFHSSAPCNKYNPRKGLPEGPVRWPAKNEIVYPPQQPGEERRPAWVCHMREHIKYSPLKLWYIACLIRGMSIDEAVKQLNFVAAKGAKPIKEALLEAQEIAVKEHNVEYKSNLWVAESFVGKACFVQGYRRHARARFGVVQYKYAHYFVRLEEGKPPKHHYEPVPTGEEMLKNYFDNWRKRRVVLSL